MKSHTHIMKDVYIRGIGKYVPERILTNYELEKLVETNDEWITTRTGIKERRIAADDQAASDLGYRAAQEALCNACIEPDDIDLIIVATVSGDWQMPATACVIQGKLRAKNAAAFDISAACAGFPFALSIGSQFIRTGVYKNVLIVCTEVLSRFTDWQNRRTCVLFGDGAGAAVITSIPAKRNSKIVSSYLATDGDYATLIYTPAGGSRTPASSTTIEKRLHYIKMESNAVLGIAVKCVGDAVRKILYDNNMTVGSIDTFIPHQASLPFIRAVAKETGIPDDKVFVNVNKYGNMSSATTIIGLYDAVQQGIVKQDSTALLAAFGGGFAWAATLIHW